MTLYRDEREALLNRVQLLERALGKERAEREATIEERERLVEELTALRRELAGVNGPPIIPTQARWAAIMAVVGLAAMTSVFVGRRVGCPRGEAADTVAIAPITPVASLPAYGQLPVPPPIPPTIDLIPPMFDGSAGAARDEPTRAEVHQQMRAAHRRMCSCMGPHSGHATVRVVFSGETGRVLAAEVTPRSDLTDPQAVRCIQREVEKAQVQPFTRSSASVTYPFIF